MTCGGCSGAVDRVLKKMDGEQNASQVLMPHIITLRTGLESYEISLEKQSVVVRPTTATYDEVLEKIKKTGKEVSKRPLGLSGRRRQTWHYAPRFTEYIANLISRSAAEKWLTLQVKLVRPPTKSQLLLFQRQPINNDVA